MSVPLYFVQTQDDVLHAYYSITTLRVDLVQNKSDRVKIYRLEKGGFTARYTPCSEEQLKEGNEK